MEQQDVAWAGTSVLNCPGCGGMLSVAIHDQARTSAPLSPVSSGVREALFSPMASDQDFDTQVMRYVAEGMTDTAIAGRLDVPLHRIKRSLHEWMIRLGADNRTAAAVTALREGLI